MKPSERLILDRLLLDPKAGGFSAESLSLMTLLEVRLVRRALTGLHKQGKVEQTRKPTSPFQTWKAL